MQQQPGSSQQNNAETRSKGVCGLPNMLQSMLAQPHGVASNLLLLLLVLQGSSHPTSSDQVMQALVQHNRRHILAAAGAAAGPPASEDQQQQQQQQRPAVLVVGYVMKPSREEQLASAGLLPLLPGADGLCFMPFDVGQLTADYGSSNAAAAAIHVATPQQQQQQQQGHIDLLLHKGSDELLSGADGGLAWSGRLLALQAWLRQEQQQHICVVDPFENTAKVGSSSVEGGEVHVHVLWCMCSAAIACFGCTAA
jgi:hypothetical protein